MVSISAPIRDFLTANRVSSREGFDSCVVEGRRSRIWKDSYHGKFRGHSPSAKLTVRRHKPRCSSQHSSAARNIANTMIKDRTLNRAHDDDLLTSMASTRPATSVRCTLGFLWMRRLMAESRALGILYNMISVYANWLDSLPVPYLSRSVASLA